MVNTKQTPGHLVYKHHLNLMVSHVKPCMGATSEEVDCLQWRIIKAKFIKFKEVTRKSLENTKHMKTYVVHIEANKIKVMGNSYDEVFGS